jgi:uncharacterized protein involved in response to NO
VKTAGFLKVAAQEPFRLFFPQAMLAGIIGVLLWPLHFWHVTEFYPGVVHIRIMIFGFFGGFIFGFLGTALPRMLSAKPFTVPEVALLLFFHAAAVVMFVAQRIFIGDVFVLALLLVFLACASRRFGSRKDVPPPGFVLVALAFLSVLAGTVLALVHHYYDLPLFWVYLQRLLATQGFVLLPILGIGPFILPRFFGMQSTHDFRESLRPPSGWTGKAFLALATGALILISFVVEAAGWFRFGHALRFLTAGVYLWRELPIDRAPRAGSALGACLRIALALLLMGFLAVTLFPTYRVSLLHLTLMGGFAVITFVVATRVVFGHSGNLEKLRGPNYWLFVAAGLMLLGMATRISGDLWPPMLVSHYIYGTLSWVSGALLWAVIVLPNVLRVEKEG